MRRRQSGVGGAAEDGGVPTRGHGLGSRGAISRGGSSSSNGSGSGGGGGGGGASNGGPHHQQQQSEAVAGAVQAKEAARSKIIVRVTMGALLVGLFFGVAWAGHIYIFLLICVRVARGGIDCAVVVVSCFPPFLAGPPLCIPFLIVADPN